jgi:hypothetical protein
MNISSFMTNTPGSHDLGEPTIVDRIEALHRSTGLSFGELAKRIGVSRTCLHVVRRGQQEPTRKFELRFEAAERALLPKHQAAGRAPANDALVRKALEVFKQAIVISEATPCARITYKRAGENQPFEIPLIPLSAAEGTGLVLQGLVTKDWQPLLKASLPSEYASEEFIDKLDPHGYLSLLQACLAMVMGTDWPEKMKALENQLRQGATRSEAGGEDPNLASNPKERTMPPQPAVGSENSVTGQNG